MSNTAQTLEALHAGAYKRTTRLKLSSPTILTFPPAILSLYTTLTTLDLSFTGLSSLPESISRLHNLKILFCSSCNFSTFPAQLAHCRSLEMLAFKSNRMTGFPASAAEAAGRSCFPRKLRWLILTDNEIAELPGSIGECGALEKCMLAGNRLRRLPREMARCRKLGLLRVARNQIEEFPEWVLGMPELAFFSFAGNPCVSGPVLENSTSQTSMASDSSATVIAGAIEPTELQDIPWANLKTHEVLGSGASGVIYKGTWRRQTQDGDSDRDHSPKQSQQDLQVAIKLFKGAITSDGSPLDELAACITAGAHPNLISPLGRITYDPSLDPSAASDSSSNDTKQGLVLQLIPPTYTVLGQPPTMQTCTRDVFASTLVLSVETCKRILVGVARAAERLHARGVVHGDLYAHNILVDGRGDALLGDFGAATVLPGGRDGRIGEAKYASSMRKGLEKMEVLAMGHLVEDLLGVLERKVTGFEDADGDDVLSEKDAYVIEGLNALHWKCTDPVVDQRPDFREVREILEGF